MEKLLVKSSRPIFETGNIVGFDIKEIIYRDGVLLERITVFGQEPVETIIKDPDLLAKEQQAETDAGAIPGWATWNEQQALDYIENNVVDLNSAKSVLKALARMTIALRNKTFPNLEE